MQELGAPPGGAKQKEGIEPSRKLGAEESPMKGLRLVPPFLSLQPGPGLGLGGREGGSLDVAAALGYGCGREVLCSSHPS